jgi:hypothetical protein
MGTLSHPRPPSERLHLETDDSFVSYKDQLRCLGSLCRPAPSCDRSSPTPSLNLPWRKRPPVLSIRSACSQGITQYLAWLVPGVH